MSITQDSVFNKEFKNMLNTRKARNAGFSLASLPLPDFSELGKDGGMSNGLSKLKICLIKGIKEIFFERLNETEVQLVGRSKLKKRQVLSDGSFRTDSSGNFVLDDITVPQSSIAVFSPISIGLRRTVETEGGKSVTHRVSEGFKYVDYVDTKHGRKYIYIVPRDYVLELRVNALALSFTKHRNYYHGAKIALQNGHYIYLYLLPYNYRENHNSHILGLKASLDFKKEINLLLSHWVSNDVMFPINHTAFTEQVGGVTNTGFLTFEGTILSDDYSRVGDNLVNAKDLESME